MTEGDDLNDLGLKLRSDFARRAFPQGAAIATKGDRYTGRDKLRTKLFPKRYVASPKGPQPALPIDKLILEMSKRLRPLSELHDKHHFIKCHFMIARAYVYRAFEAAEAESRYGEWQRREQRAALKFCIDTEAWLQKHLVHRQESPEALWLMDKTTADLKNYIASVKDEIFRLQSFVSRRPSAKGDVWKIRFARTLGYGWRDLVGRSPAWTQEGDFIFLHFVRAAFQTVGGSASETWERPCRTAIKQERRLPLEEQWDYRRLIREAPIFKVQQNQPSGR
jgi:hypothetical protein